MADTTRSLLYTKIRVNEGDTEIDVSGISPEVSSPSLAELCRRLTAR